MRDPQQRICRLADEAAEIKEPEEALKKLRELRAELDDYERVRVAEALRGGSSFGSIAKALGVSRQAAHRRYRDLAPRAAETMPLSSHARRAVHLARGEATAAGARRVGSEHLLLGVLRSGGSASLALEAGGVTAEAARRCSRVEANSANGSAHVNYSERDVPVRAILTEAAEIARARHSHYVEAEHVALAALNGRDGGAMRAITALGVTPGAVRERLAC